VFVIIADKLLTSKTFQASVSHDDVALARSAVQACVSHDDVALARSSALLATKMYKMHLLQK
jgi:hypothetical protein